MITLSKIIIKNCDFSQKMHQSGLTGCFRGNAESTRSASNLPFSITSVCHSPL